MRMDSLERWMARAQETELSTGTAVAADDVGAITQLKNLRLQTVLVSGGRPTAAIVAPSGKYDQAVAIIQQAIRKSGGALLPVVTDSEDADVLLADQSIIALGNMAASKFIYTLYRQWYTMLDLRWPGKNGYAIHSLHDPYATGHNVLLLGGSDDAGVLRAAQRFAETLETGSSTHGSLTVGWRLEVQLGEDVPSPPEPDEQAYAWADCWRLDDEGKEMGHGKGPLGYFGWNPMIVPAVLYYMTGQEKYLHEFLRRTLPDPDNIPAPVRKLFVERYYPSHYNLTRPVRISHHYASHRFALIWDLIEESPLISDEQRLKITDDIRRHHPLMHRYGLGHSRHGSYVALTVFAEARYFNKYYPSRQWQESLEKAHETFMWWTRHPTWGERDTIEWINSSMYPVATYFTLTDPTPWLESGLAQIMIETLPVIWSGKPFERSVECLSPNLGNMASWLLNDGRFAYMTSKMKYDPTLFRMGRSWWPSPELQDVAPTNLVGRVSVVPVAEPDAKARNVNFNHRQAYNLLSYRSGVGPEDGFLMMDGFNGGGRNPYHVSALIALRSGGRELLSGFGNQVHVLRDGLSAGHVAMAAQLKAHFAGEGMAYIQSVVPEASFSAWKRQVLWIDDQLTLVADTITAEEAGDYEVCCQWEPSEVLHPNSAEPRRAQSDGDRPITLVADRPVRIERSPGPLQGAYAHAKELTDDLLLSQTRRVTLEKGGQASLVNAVYADDAPGRFSYHLDPVSDQVTLVSGKMLGIWVTAPCEVGELAIDAESVFLSDQRLFVHNGRCLRLGQTALVYCDVPVTLVWNLSQFVLTVQAPGAVSLSLRLLSSAAPEIEGRPARVRQDESLTTIDLPAGEHRLTGMAPGFIASLSSALNRLQPQRLDAAAQQLARSTVNWRPAWQTSIGADVRLMEVADDAGEAWIASDAPALHRVGFNGAVRWRHDLPCPAEAMALSPNLIVAGGHDNQLRAFDAQGQWLWTVESQVWPNFLTGDRWDAAWFTDPKQITGIRSLLIGDLLGRGSPQVLVGRPTTVEAWTPDGKLINRSPVRWGEMSRLALVQHEQGRRLLLGSFYNLQDMLRLVDENLQADDLKAQLQSYMLPVPPGVTEMMANLQRGIAELRAVDINGDGQQEVIVARSGHWNDVRAYNADGSRCLWLYSFGPAAPRSVQEIKGRFVRSLSIAPENNQTPITIAVGLANGWTHCVSADGRRLWSHRSPTMVTTVAHVGGSVTEDWGVAVGRDDGSLVLLDARGEVMRTAQLDGSIRVLAAVQKPQPLLLAASSRGQLAAFAP